MERLGGGNRTRHDDNLALQALEVLVIDEDFRHLGEYVRAVVICLVAVG